MGASSGIAAKQPSSAQSVFALSRTTCCLYSKDSPCCGMKIPLGSRDSGCAVVVSFWLEAVGSFPSPRFGSCLLGPFTNRVCFSDGTVTWTVASGEDLGRCWRYCSAVSSYMSWKDWRVRFDKASGPQRVAWCWGLTAGFEESGMLPSPKLQVVDVRTTVALKQRLGVVSRPKSFCKRQYKISVHDRFGTRRQRSGNIPNTTG